MNLRLVSGLALVLFLTTSTVSWPLRLVQADPLIALRAVGSQQTQDSRTTRAFAEDAEALPGPAAELAEPAAEPLEPAAELTGPSAGQPEPAAGVSDPAERLPEPAAGLPGPAAGDPPPAESSLPATANDPAAPAEEIPRIATNQHPVTVLYVRHARARDIARIVEQFVGRHGNNFSLAVDERTNMILVQGDEASIKKVEDLPNVLDMPAQSPPEAVPVGPTNAPRPPSIGIGDQRQAVPPAADAAPATAPADTVPAATP